MKVGRLVELVCIWDVEEARIIQNHMSPFTSRVLVWALYNLVKKKKERNPVCLPSTGVELKTSPSPPPASTTHKHIHSLLMGVCVH